MDFEYTKRYTVFDEPLPLTDLKTDNFYATNSIGIAGTSSSYELYVQGDTRITGILSAANVVIDYVDAKTANLGIATIGTASVGSIGIRTTNTTGIGSTSTVFGVLGDTTVTGYQYRGSRIKTASLTVRGGGLNQSNGNNRFVALNNTILYDGAGRGLTLTIIGTGLTHVSTVNYDVFGDPVASDNLAAAISGISTGQIGVLSSADAWELSVTDNLRTAARRVGLSKLGNFYYPGGGSYRRPYAAVFSGIGTNLNSSPHDVIERMESRDSNALYASIFCTIASDEVGVSIHGATSTNVLYSADSDIEEPVLLVDSKNNVGIGTTNPLSTLHVEGGNTLFSNVATALNQYDIGPYIQIIGKGGPTGALDVYPGYNVECQSNLYYSACELLMQKARVDGGGNRTVPSTGDSIGNVIARAWSSTNGGQWENAAYINFILNSANITGSGNHPSADIVFYGRGFSSTGQYASDETIRIKGDYGYLLANTTANDGGGTGVWGRITSKETSANVNGIKAVAANGGYFVSVGELECTASASSAYRFLTTVSGAAPAAGDIEHRLQGDGNAYADGSWFGGGADYAEMFEWLDGNPENEDRRGISVVLEGDKIRPAEFGEDPIGVISSSPVVLGDSSWNKWSEKHLRDDFGSYIWESHEVIEWTDENGKLCSYESHIIPENVEIPENHIVKTVDNNGNPFKHRKINPLWDPNLEYIPRENRPEWSPVGLMGKLRIRKNQPTGSRWIKMRDVSEQVEEWLVR